MSDGQHLFHWPAKGEPQKGNAQKVTFKSLKSDLKGDQQVFLWLDPLLRFLLIQVIIVIVTIVVYSTNINSDIDISHSRRNNRKAPAPAPRP